MIWSSPVRLRRTRVVGLRRVVGAAAAAPRRYGGGACDVARCRRRPPPRRCRPARRRPRCRRTSRPRLPSRRSCDGGGHRGGDDAAHPCRHRRPSRRRRTRPGRRRRARPRRRAAFLAVFLRGLLGGLLGRLLVPGRVVRGRLVRGRLVGRHLGGLLGRLLLRLLDRVGDLEEHRRRGDAARARRRARRRLGGLLGRGLLGGGLLGGGLLGRGLLGGGLLGGVFFAAVFLAASSWRAPRRSTGSTPKGLPKRWWSRPRACTAPRPGCLGSRVVIAAARSPGAASSLHGDDTLVVSHRVRPIPAAVAGPELRSLSPTGRAASRSGIDEPRFRERRRVDVWSTFGEYRTAAPLATQFTGRSGSPISPVSGSSGPWASRVSRGTPTRSRPCERGQPGQHVVGADGRLEVAQHQVEHRAPLLRR